MKHIESLSKARKKKIFMLNDRAMGQKKKFML